MTRLAVFLMTGALLLAHGGIVNAQESAQGWSAPRCKKDPFDEQVNCSTVVLESPGPAGYKGIPSALFAWMISKPNDRVLVLLSLSSPEEPLTDRDRKKALNSLLVRVDDRAIHTIKEADLILSLEGGPPYRQMFELSDELLLQMAKGEKIYLRFKSNKNDTSTKEFSLSDAGAKITDMAEQFMKMRGK